MQSREVDAEHVPFNTALLFDTVLSVFPVLFVCQSVRTGRRAPTMQRLIFATVNNPSDVIINPSDPNEFYVADWGNNRC